MMNGTGPCLFIATNRPLELDRLAREGMAVPDVNQCRFPLLEWADLITGIIHVVLCI